jgi:hypothetical protein
MPIDWPAQHYLPGAKVRLVLRFDNFTDSDVIRGLVPTIPPKNLKGIKAARNNLSVSVDPDSPPGAHRFILSGKSGKPGTSNPIGGVGSAPQSADEHVFALEGIIPRKAGWKLNGIRFADTLELEVRWQDMPFDPRVIRSCAVFYYLGTLAQEQFSRGVRGERRETRDGSGPGEPANLVPDTFVDPMGRQRSNLRFQGWVDKWSMTWGDEEPFVKLECCDNTRLLIDQQMPTLQHLDPKKPIDEAIADLLSQFPQMEGFTVEYRPMTIRREPAGPNDAGVPPRLGNLLGHTAKVPGAGVPMGKGGGSVGGEGNNVWDYLTDCCGLIAHSIRVEGTAIIVQRVSNLVGSTASPRTDDPYVPKDLASGRFPVRAFIYGRNIAELEISHEYTRKKATNIEVRVYSPRRKIPFVGRFPEKGDRIIHAAPGDAAEQKWTVFRGPVGITDEKLLKKIAEDVYNNFGRNELEVRVKTKNLASFGSGNADPDLFDVKAGDNIEVLVNREKGVATQTDFEHDLDAAAKFLQGLGYESALARTYAEVVTNAGLQRVYRLKEASFDWDAESGVEIELMLVNYIEARLDKRPSDLASDKDTDPTAPK